MNKYSALIIVFFLVLIWSGIQPHDYFTWFLEVIPALVGLAVLLLTRKKFEFTYFAYTFILVHCIILFVGGKYTYAEVPLFNWIRDTFEHSRNNYDKIGHFAQGFIPAIITRELFIRKNIVKKGGWLAFLTVCVSLSFSAFYEFIEWFVAVFSGESAESFLGTQGYVWDTQSDMLWATIGAVVMVVLFSKIHDKAIAKMK